MIYWRVYCSNFGGQATINKCFSNEEDALLCYFECYVKCFYQNSVDRSYTQIYKRKEKKSADLIARNKSNINMNDITSLIKDDNKPWAKQEYLSLPILFEKSQYTTEVFSDSQKKNAYKRINAIIDKEIIKDIIE